LRRRLKRQKNQSVLVVRPRFETATQYGWYYQNKYVIEKCKQLNIPYVDLEKTKATKKYFNQAIATYDPVLITGTGHGNPIIFTGQNYSPLLTKYDTKDARLIKGRWLSLLSCEFGQSFDWWIWQGVKGIYGYNRTFYFIAETYPNDIASMFFDAHHTFDLCLLDGLSAKEAFDKTVLTFNKYIANASEDVARHLVWDRDSMVFMGDWRGNPFKSEKERYKIILVGTNTARLWDRVKGRVEIIGECTLEELE